MARLGGPEPFFFMIGTVSEVLYAQIGPRERRHFVGG